MRPSAPQGDGAVDVQHIYASQSAFAALKADGGVVSWGSGGRQSDGIGDPIELGYSKVQDQLVNVQSICSTAHAFAVWLSSLTWTAEGLATAKR